MRGWPRGRTRWDSRWRVPVSPTRPATLRSGIDGTAVVRFLADGHRANEFTHLAYLELEVTVAGGLPYQVETGEYLNPADPTRVAVDWERSLRSE